METATEFTNRLSTISPLKRETEVLNVLLSKNIPDFLFKEVSITVVVTNKEKTDTIVYKVMPDYLSVGTDADYIRMPMYPMTAQKIADSLGYVLPTRKMVDQIYQAATIKLSPKPYTPKQGEPGRGSLKTFINHNKTIEKQKEGKLLGELVAGHKKDVVITNKLLTNKNRVAIYGWHQLNNKPIQPLSLVHSETYLDYSHGIRLINKKCLLNGVETSIENILKDKNLNSFLSDEGMLKTLKY